MENAPAYLNLSAASACVSCHL